MKNKKKNPKNRFKFNKPWVMYFIPLTLLVGVIWIGIGWLENKYGFLP